MSKKRLITLIVSVIVIILLGVLVFSYFHFFADSPKKDEAAKPVSETAESEKEVLPDYDRIFAMYAKHMENNESFFSRGMMLCDLNEDKIPELFSIAYDEMGDVVYLHFIKDGKVMTPAQTSPRTFVDVYDLIRPSTFYEDPLHFIGIYKNKKTGQKALINSVADHSENDRFDIVTYDGKKPVFKDEGVKAAVEERWPVLEKRDLIMADYELCEDKLFTRFLIRGEYSKETGNNPVNELKNLIEEFKNHSSVSDAKTVENEEFYCYIKNINLENNEIVLVPAAKISYEEYAKAMNGDKIYSLNGELMSIQTDEAMLSEQGVATLYANPGVEYSFTVPSPGGSASVITGYLGMPPVKASLSGNLKVRYGVLGEYDDNGEPTGYESLGRKNEYTIDEYVQSFATFNMGSYYKATVKDGSLVFLDVLYKP